MDRKVQDERSQIIRRSVLTMLTFHDDLKRYCDFSDYDKAGLANLEASFLKSLSQLGVTRMNTKVGDKYDPKYHEAVATLETTERSESDQLVIAELVNIGFLLNDTQVLRPSKVIAAWK